MFIASTDKRIQRKKTVLFGHRPPVAARYFSTVVNLRLVLPLCRGPRVRLIVRRHDDDSDIAEASHQSISSVKKGGTNSNSTQFFCRLQSLPFSLGMRVSKALAGTQGSLASLRRLSTRSGNWSLPKEAVGLYSTIIVVPET